MTVNGNSVSDASIRIDDENDIVAVLGKRIEVRKAVYLMMHKPSGFVCAKRDGLYETVFDLLGDPYRTPFFEENLHTIGRLDCDTEGLLILTTDGALTHRITATKSECGKTYVVRLAKKVRSEEGAAYVCKCAQGVHIEPEGREKEADCKSAELVWLGSGDEKDECTLTIYEGKFHEVKRIFSALGNEVVYLKRTAIGTLRLDESLERGGCRELSEDEIELLYRI
ncbi:pseudouridine synthase [uncultured Campylobacter sp.]|uniref:pseudouridine synthase n=1 Tax=uncultured Campylobacter sp. TaxID=218934 RepID=UPI0028E48712|nr:pseudouridine synthase [uncultured Campylobacter sp.]